MRPIVRKVVFPAAGWGTRFLPATKSLPKEMLPLVDKPLIQYGVEEAWLSGVENVIIVTGRGKSAIEDHFDVSFELERALEKRGSIRELEIVRRISNLITICYIRQKEPLGLGHAVALTRSVVGDEPFAVVLPDELLCGETPALRQLLDVHEKVRGAVVAVMEAPRNRLSSYGVVDAEPVENGSRKGLYRVRNVVEKPSPEQAPSNLAIVGRYILPPDIFQDLEAIEPGSGGELQLTDALNSLAARQPVYAYRFEGRRYDAGGKLGFLQATVEHALRRDDLGPDFRTYLKNLDL